MLSKELLDILACPKCKSEVKEQDDTGKEIVKQVDLVYDEKNQKLICEQCKLKYSIEDGIPVMLIDEAESY